MGKRKNIIAVLLVVLTIIVLCDCQNKGNRTPSTTGSLECSNAVMDDSLHWNVCLLNPFDIDSSQVVKFHHYQKYLFMPTFHFFNRDSIISSFQFTEISSIIDSLEPGIYHVLINCQKPYYQDSTPVFYGNETIYSVPDVMNPFIYKPIFISNVRISADSISLLNVDSFLEIRINEYEQLIHPLEPDLRQIVYSEWTNRISHDDRF